MGDQVLSLCFKKHPRYYSTGPFHGSKYIYMYLFLQDLVKNMTEEECCRHLISIVRHNPSVLLESEIVLTKYVHKRKVMSCCSLYTLLLWLLFGKKLLKYCCMDEVSGAYDASVRTVVINQIHEKHSWK